MESLKRDYTTIDGWALDQDTIGVDFEKIIEDPHAVAQRIQEWLGETLDVDTMAAAVLKREPICAPGMLETKLMGCSECGRPCDPPYGFGPSERHCSEACHDAAIRRHAKANMTPAEREVYGDLDRIKRG